MTLGRELHPALNDPHREHLPLPLKATLYPIGFPVEIATNSAAVIDAAQESWGFAPREFDREPIRIRVVVEAGGSEPAPEPVFRSQQGLMMIVSDRDHFAVCDLRSRFGWCYTSSNMLADRGWFRWYFLEAMVYMLLAHHEVVFVHAACVVRNGRGVLLCGASGSGKSTLAFACARAGWAYVTDDATVLLQGAGGREALRKAYHFRFRPEAVDLFPGLAGRGTPVRPNGKPTIEVMLSALPEIETASRCRIEAVVFLNRRGRSEPCPTSTVRCHVGQGSDLPTRIPHTFMALPHVRPLTRKDAIRRLLENHPVYQEEVWRRHREAIQDVCEAPAYELRYETFSQAIPLLSELVDQS